MGGRSFPCHALDSSPLRAYGSCGRPRPPRPVGILPAHRHTRVPRECVSCGSVCGSDDGGPGVRAQAQLAQNESETKRSDAIRHHLVHLLFFQFIPLLHRDGQGSEAKVRGGGAEDIGYRAGSTSEIYLYFFLMARVYFPLSFCFSSHASTHDGPPTGSWGYGRMRERRSSCPELPGGLKNSGVRLQGGERGGEWCERHNRFCLSALRSPYGVLRM